jgi:putative tricarboxylic transport membrane protein
MLDSMLEALQLVFTPNSVVYMVGGVALGLLIGVLPGLGGTVGMALLLPFVYGMDQSQGIALLVGFVAVGSTSDTFPSILLGVPGSGGAQATIMDGYPMARQGRAGEAIGASLSASMIGGIIGAISLAGAVYLARPIIMALASPELLMLSLLGLSTVGVLARGAPLAGILAAVFGLLLATVGGAPATPAYRYTFDSVYLLDGIGLPLVALGLFALPEIVELLAKNESIAKAAQLTGGIAAGFRATLHNKLLLLRSSVIGMFIGIIPGLGGTAASWITYGMAQKTSRNSAGFGKGDVRGVIAPESANNAVDGGALVPTLMLGIPGSGSTAILLAGLLLLGLDVGPNMINEQLPLTLSIAWTLAFANVVGCLGCLLLANRITRISLLPAKLLAPFLIVVMVAAAYQTTHDFRDFAVLIGLAVVGYAMKSAGWSRAPILVGFVLAPSVERYLHLTISRYGDTWVTRPYVLLIGALILVVLVSGLVRRPRRNGSAVGVPDELVGK